jgi:hypothetical protein
MPKSRRIGRWHILVSSAVKESMTLPVDWERPAARGAKESKGSLKKIYGSHKNMTMPKS